MADIQTYKPMYKVRPYFVIKKVKLPDCMYLLKPLHKLPSLGGEEESQDTQRALESLEYRQDALFNHIKELQNQIQATGQMFGLSPDDLQNLVESYVPSDTPLDVVINAPPSAPPYALLALYHYISSKVPAVIKSFVHCSTHESINELSTLFTTGGNPKVDSPKLKITIIWKEDPRYPEPTMIVSPHRQTPVQGIANICRYLSRQFCPEIYESLNPVNASQIDSWLDSVSCSYINGNAKEKASVLRHMNSSLGSSPFLTGDVLTLADIIAYTAIGTLQGLKIGANIRTWMKSCHSTVALNQIPCFYLN